MESVWLFLLGSLLKKKVESRVFSVFLRVNFTMFTYEFFIFGGYVYIPNKEKTMQKYHIVGLIGVNLGLYDGFQRVLAFLEGFRTFKLQKNALPKKTPNNPKTNITPCKQPNNSMFLNLEN